MHGDWNIRCRRRRRFERERKRVVNSHAGGAEEFAQVQNVLTKPAKKLTRDVKELLAMSGGRCLKFQSSAAAAATITT